MSEEAQMIRYSSCPQGICKNTYINKLVQKSVVGAMKAIPFLALSMLLIYIAMVEML